MISDYFLLWLICSWLQISTCMQVHPRTSWAKTQHSHAPLALLPTSTTSAQTSLKTTGSTVRACLQISTLTCRVHSKLIAFSSNYQPLYWHKELLCARGMVTGIPMLRKQPTYSFSWNFYMNAIAEPGPHLQRNLQCATKFTVLVTRPHNHTQTCTVMRWRGSLLSVYTSHVSCVLQPLMSCRVSAVVTRI